MHQCGSHACFLLQLEELDITASCAGWQLYGVSSAAAGSELVLRFGPLVRLRLFISAAAARTKRPSVRGYLEHMQPGASSENCHVLPSTMRGQNDNISCCRVSCCCTELHEMCARVVLQRGRLCRPGSGSLR